MVVFRERCVDPLECYTLMTGNLLLCERITIDFLSILQNQYQSTHYLRLVIVSLLSTVEPSNQYSSIKRAHPHFHPLKSNNQDTSRGVWIRGVPLYIGLCAPLGYFHHHFIYTCLHIYSQKMLLLSE